MFGVFIHREDSQYDDHPSEHYQFPSSYLNRAMQFGDLTVQLLNF